MHHAPQRHVHTNTYHDTHHTPHTTPHHTTHHTTPHHTTQHAPTATLLKTDDIRYACRKVQIGGLSKRSPGARAAAHRASQQFTGRGKTRPSSFHISATPASTASTTWPTNSSTKGLVTQGNQVAVTPRGTRPSNQRQPRAQAQVGNAEARSPHETPRKQLVLPPCPRATKVPGTRWAICLALCGQTLPQPTTHATLGSTTTPSASSFDARSGFGTGLLVHIANFQPASAPMPASPVADSSTSLATSSPPSELATAEHGSTTPAALPWPGASEPQAPRLTRKLPYQPSQIKGKRPLARSHPRHQGCATLGNPALSYWASRSLTRPHMEANFSTQSAPSTRPSSARPNSTAASSHRRPHHVREDAPAKLCILATHCRGEFRRENAPNALGLTVAPGPGHRTMDHRRQEPHPAPRSHRGDAHCLHQA